MSTPITPTPGRVSARGNIQCQHVKDDGEQCERWATRGHTVCKFHGSNNPPAIAAARRAMAFARMPAIEALYSIVEQFLGKTCAACGYPSGDFDAQRTTIRAAQIILDRTEMGPRSILEVRQTDGQDFDVRHLLPAERAELHGLMAQFRDFKARVKARQLAAPSPTGGPVPVTEPDATM